MLDDFNLWDKLGDIFVILTAGGVVGALRKAHSIDRRFAALELDIVKNYATKNEFTTLSDKLDHNNELLNSKIDNINSNILLLIKDRAN